MFNFKNDLRKVVAIAACLAAVMFASCDLPGDDPDDPVESKGKDADIVTFTFEGIDDKSAINKNARTVTAKAKETVDLTTLVVEFTLSKGATAKVGSKTQESKKTANDFSKPVTYSVTSGDGDTERDWTVTITGGKPAEKSPVEDVPYFSWLADFKEIIERIPPGIYQYTNKVFAKGTDGSWFLVPDLTKSSARDQVPKWFPSNFIMGDGDKRESLLGASYENWGQPQTSPIHYGRLTNHYPTSDELYKLTTHTGAFAVNAGTTLLALNTNLNMQIYKERKGDHGKWEKLPGETICGIPTTLYRHTLDLTGAISDFYVTADNVCLKHRYSENNKDDFTATHVDKEAGDMNYMLRKIADIIGNRCPQTIVNYENMVREDNYVGDRWMSEWFPASFENNYFPKYQGSMKITNFLVNRGYSPNLAVYDQVGSIEFNAINTKYDEVLAYIALLKQKNPTIVDKENNIMTPSSLIFWEGYIDNCGVVCPHPLGWVSFDFEWVVIFINGGLKVNYGIVPVRHI